MSVQRRKHEIFARTLPTSSRCFLSRSWEQRCVRERKTNEQVTSCYSLAGEDFFRGKSEFPTIKRYVLNDTFSDIVVQNLGSLKRVELIVSYSLGKLELVLLLVKFSNKLLKYTVLHIIHINMNDQFL